MLDKTYKIKPLKWKVNQDTEDILILVCQTVIGYYQIEFVKAKDLIKEFGFEYQMGFCYSKYWNIKSIEEGKEIAQKHYLKNLTSALKRV